MLSVTWWLVEDPASEQGVFFEVYNLSTRCFIQFHQQLSYCINHVTVGVSGSYFVQYYPFWGGYFIIFTPHPFFVSLQRWIGPKHRHLSHHRAVWLLKLFTAGICGVYCFVAPSLLIHYRLCFWTNTMRYLSWYKTNSWRLFTFRLVDLIWSTHVWCGCVKILGYCWLHYSFKLFVYMRR